MFGSTDSLISHVTVAVLQESFLRPIAVPVAVAMPPCPRLAIGLGLTVWVVGMRGLLRDQRRYLDLPLVFAKNRWAKPHYLRYGIFWKPTHPRVLMLVAGAVASARRPGAAVLCLPWVHERLCRQPIVETMAERVVTLPALLLLDAAEVLVMVRGSIRHRELVL